MSIEKLKSIIDDFSIRGFMSFFRQKNSSFAESYESLDQYNDERFADFLIIGEIRFDDSADRLLIIGAKILSGLTERTGKKAQYEKAKQILKDLNLYTAGIFIFYNDSNNFRFSLIYEQAIGTKRTFSNFRRFTYFVSPEITNRTFLQQIGDGDFSSLDKIKDSFSVEKVNKEFYKEIAKFFYKLTGSETFEYDRVIKLPVSEDKKIYQEFAVRLIGRIIFCWFLKHKKSPGDIPLIPESILSSEAVGRDYYHSILEKLFFDVLNTPQNERKKNILADSDKIPFLNGGLFEPHNHDFYNSNPLYGLFIPDDWFKELLVVLEQYNFTIDENSTVDIEISVDPEMLGRIFENLLAEINPETGKTARKATGSYYTPRPIVEYMVDESLKQYLITKTAINEEIIANLLSYETSETDLNERERNSVIEALDEIKVIDPACGSGAFPMGILQKMLLILQKVDPESKKWLGKQLDRIENEFYRKEIEEKLKNENWDYVHKLGIIQNSIYGVDIQPIAVEISKLRFFLSLIVDEKIDDYKPNRGVEPLPNLEFKFVVANSLIGLGNQPIIEDPGDFERLKELRIEYLNSNGEKKRHIEEEFRAIQKKMFQRSIQLGGRDSQTLKIASWDPFSNEASDWFDPEWMFGIKYGFDVVIGNPPYGVSIKGDYRIKVINNLGKVPDFEIYYYFIECAYKLLRENGIKSYIIPNTFLFNVYASDFRKKLIDSWDIKCLLDCTAFKIFEGATIRNAITAFQKNSKNDKLIGYKMTAGASGFSELSTRETNYLLRSELLDFNQNWGLAFKLDRPTISIILKIKESSLALENCFPESSQGLIAYDQYQGQERDIIESRAYHYNKKVKSDLKKWLLGKDVSRYIVKWNGNEWIDYCKGIANPRQPKFFKGPRILIREITNPSIFCAYTEEEFYHDPAIIVVLDNKHRIKTLLGILNSKLASFYHLNSSPKATKGAFPKILVEDIKKFPFKKIMKGTENIIADNVNRILAIAKDDDYLTNTEKQAKVKEYEDRID